ncbi:hypothetical protein BDN72DRAFT_405784 [Pluteus cervinus]|uniref:Uncharacterized protein n=1 Tax=Pluteus cervinus TaxID=181527 RepID=A0ACD3A8Y4_9AGAR|nr:hypothetical protein BDN72DRAFT_405784 [Pluteus cervinus]
MTSLHLPSELHELILSHFKPINDLHTALSSPDSEAIFRRYQKSVCSSAQLRFVNRTWNHFLTPSIYNLLVIPSRPSTPCRNRLQALDYHPELVHTIILRSGGPGQERYDLQEEDANLLRDSLKGCTHLVGLETWVGRELFLASGRTYLPRVFDGINSPHFRSAVFFSMDLKTMLGGFGVMEDSIRNGLTELVITKKRDSMPPAVEGEDDGGIGTTPRRLRHLSISGRDTFLNDPLFTHFLVSSPPPSLSVSRL